MNDKYKNHNLNQTNTKYLEKQNIEEINKIHENLLKNPIFKRWLKEDEPEYKQKVLIIRKTFWFFLILSLVIYLAIFIIFPHHPNSDLLLKLNNFMNEYLLGCWLPELSDKFSFKLKSVWCFSLLINFLISISFFVIHFIVFNKNDLLLLDDLDKDLDDKKSIFYSSFGNIFRSLILYFSATFCGIYFYAYGGVDVQNPNKYKIIEYDFFYQNLYPSLGMFLVSITVILCGIMMLSSSLNLFLGVNHD